MEKESLRQKIIKSGLEAKLHALFNEILDNKRFNLFEELVTIGEVDLKFKLHPESITVEKILPEPLITEPKILGLPINVIVDARNPRLISPESMFPTISDKIEDVTYTKRGNNKK